MKHILFIDDDVNLCRIYSIFFKESGYHITLAYSGNQALKILKEKNNNFDLIISDYLMPDGNGDIVINYIESLDPNNRPNLFIFSGFSTEEIEAKGVVSNFELLRKPVTPNVLLSKVKEYLER